VSISDLQDAKEQVRQAVDIVDLVGSYVSLRREGRNYVALCPWHDDSRPSLKVNPDRQSFKCWVCNIGGDIFSFMMRVEGLEFREALEMLADRAGVELRLSGKPAGRDSQFERRNLFAAMAWAEEVFHKCLLHSPEAEVARQYLADRDITEESIHRFHLGYSPNSWDWLLGQAAGANFSPEVLERVGLVLRRNSGTGFYDRFRGRLLFSIRDPRARPIAFGGRVLPGTQENPDRPEAKYINSPETPLFSKSSQLYALDLARTGGATESGLIVMEGYTDVIMAHQHGVTNAVAVLGTALGEKHIPVLRRFTDSVTLVLDGDAAGQNRTMQILDDLLALFVSHEIDLRILALPSGADPCDVISQHGSEEFHEILSHALDALDYKIEAVTNGLESAPGTHRTALAVEAIIGTLAKALPGSVGAGSSVMVREQQVLARVSRRFGVDEGTLRTRLGAIRREQQSSSRKSTSNKPSEAHHHGEQRAPLAAWESELLELLVHHPEVLPPLADAIRSDEITNPQCREVFAACLQMMHAGQVPTFDQLMLACDDAATKSLLVDCDEEGRARADSDTQQRVQDLLQFVAKQKQNSEHLTQIAELRQNRHDPQHEQELLLKLFDDLKRRQAGSLPTDG